ncbi:hypothetical protein [Desertivirga brevis]|uniref:hypothetical protein n=1 Tax=Desertivirga brevis TaxID=2810310 RepID=UPI001A96B569|nr:hypothetical protein [Pedobacter sp. SYSU D00873]
MKHLLYATLLTIFSVAGFAAENIDKKDDSKNISYNAKRQLEAEFAGAKDVTWTANTDYQKASFSFEGKKITALFDIQGNYLGATQVVAFEELPAEAKKSIEKYYKGFAFSGALKVVARPSNDYQSNDVGTYWIDLAKDSKEVYLNYTSSTGLSFYKNVESAASAKN